MVILFSATILSVIAMWIFRLMWRKNPLRKHAVLGVIFGGIAVVLALTGFFISLCISL